MDRSASRRRPGAATISARPPTARSSRSCRTGSIALSPNRARRTHPRSGTPTSAGVATTTEQLPDDRVSREARKRRHAKKRCGRKDEERMTYASTPHTCRDDQSVLYYRVPRLLDALALARGDGRYVRLLKSLARVELLILDDWGLAPLTSQQGRDLLEIVDDRHRRGSTIVTSQLPVDHWHEAIANPTVADAILDRLVHNAHRLTLNGDSMRKAAAKRSGLDARPAP